MAINFSDTTPVAPVGGTNVKWQPDGSGNISAYLPASGGNSSPFTAPPLLSAFTWVNQGSASAQQSSGAYTNPILIAIPNAGSLNWRLLVKPIPTAAPYTLIAYLKSQQQGQTVQVSGIYVYDGAKLMGLETISFNYPSTYLRVVKSNDVVGTGNTESAVLPHYAMYGFPYGMWARLRNNGTNLFFDYSFDGSNWQTLYTEATGAFITPVSWGFGGLNQVGSGGPEYLMSANLLSWQELPT